MQFYLPKHARVQLKHARVQPKHARVQPKHACVQPKHANYDFAYKCVETKSGTKVLFNHDFYIYIDIVLVKIF